MILSVSRRTDIPCYYSDWFMNRIRSGYVMTRNPMNPSHVHRIELSPDVTDCIVFWTKDPMPMMHHLDELDHLGYSYYFQFTLTPYDRNIERNLRPKAEIEETFIQLSKKIGKHRTVWRYDPIILNHEISAIDHKYHFKQMCDRLSAYTDTVIISFVDIYKKNKHMQLRSVAREEIEDISLCFAQVAKAYGLHIVACCEEMDLSSYGIQRSACIDKKRIERIIGYPLSIRNDMNQRTNCGCYEAVDIGSYNTCLNDCIYCYANTSLSTAKKRYECHDPLGEILIGYIGDSDRIIQKKCHTNRTMQISMFE